MEGRLRLATGDDRGAEEAWRCGLAIATDDGASSGDQLVTSPMRFGSSVTAAITKDAAADLDLTPGDAIVLIVKSTEVIVAKATG